MGRILVVVSTFCLCLRAQSYPCQADPQLNEFRSEVYRGGGSAGDRAKRFLDRLEHDGANYFLKLWYLEALRAKNSNAVEDARKAMEAHPGDFQFEFLYARALVGKNTPEALKLLRNAVADHPDFPQVYAPLLEVYASPKFKDEPKLADAFLTYGKLCPEHLDGYGYLRSVTDPRASREIAQRLRSTLSGHEKPENAHLYSSLWSAEFRGTPVADHDSLRARVREDILRLQPLADNRHASIYNTIAEGYKLVGDFDAASAATEEYRQQSGGAAMAAYSDWRKEHPLTTAEGQEAYRYNSVQLLKVAGEWIRKWPNDATAWEHYFNALTSQEHPRRDEIERAGLRWMELDAKRPVLSSNPPKLRVAQGWARFYVREDEIPKLLEEGIQQAGRFGNSSSDLYPSFTSNISFTSPVVTARVALIDIFLEKGESEKAFGQLSEMQMWFERSTPKEGDEYGATTYQRFRAQYESRMAQALLATGKTSEAKEHAGLAAKSGNGVMYDSRSRNLAYEVWRETGGTTSDWKTLTSKSTAAKGPVTVTAAKDPGSRLNWTRMQTPLPDMPLTDMQGKTWTVADFRGKKTLVNLWATWCGPCIAELPHFQELYEKLKDRPDVQVISFNVDESIGLIEPFLKKNHYTFPVLLSKAYVDQIVPELSIPRNWIVDVEGAVRFETVGFGTSDAKWIDQIVAKIDEPLK